MRRADRSSVDASVFESLDYKRYMRQQIAAHGDVYGYKSRLAAAAGCQKSYLSQVLNGAHDLTLEHAAGLAAFWQLPRLDGEYFMELVNWARASSPRFAPTCARASSASKRPRVSRPTI